MGGNVEQGNSAWGEERREGREERRVAGQDDEGLKGGSSYSFLPYACH
jgi:hypothetical protein